MRFEELIAVRRLKSQIAEQEQKLAMLQACAANIAPTLDGLPRGTKVVSSVEKFGCVIADTERQISELYDRLENTITNLIKIIDTEYSNPVEKSLLINYYLATSRLTMNEWFELFFTAADFGSFFVGVAV